MCCYNGVVGNIWSIQPTFWIAEPPIREEVAPDPIRLPTRQQSGRSVKMNAYWHLVPRLRIHAVTSL
jgi:hypothetical protein